MTRLFSPLINNKFWALGFLAFSSGAIVMGLELVTSRILTPVFGSSTYTWGSLIGIILTGLSIGYFIGGKLADKNPSFSKLCSVIFSAGLYTIFIPFIAPSVLGFSVLLLPASQFAPLFATFILLILPSILLGFVSPYAIKLATKKLSKLGNISGSLYSLSTTGSILGTFLTVFVLIPTLEVREIIFGLGVALMLVSLIGLRIPPKVIVVLVIVILFTPSSSVVLGLLSHSGDSLYEKETPYSHLDVTDTKQFRTLYLNGLRHSQMDKDDPNALTLQYTKYFHFGTVFNPDIEKVLFVGGGGFSGPKSFLSIYPKVLVDVVEIDPDVIDVAKKYFEVQENPRLRIFNDDGRNFLLNNDEKYDLIILDAYANDYVPYHLLTVEYFQLLNNKLNPDGIIISNIVGSLVGDTSNLLRAGYKTMDYVFPTPYVFTTLENNIGSVQNIIFVITKTETQYDKNYLLKSIEGNSILNIDDLNNFYEKGINVEDVPLLTDEFAPVENLLNPITSRSFMPSGPQHTGVESEIWWSESTAVTIGLLLAIVMFWPFHLKLIWKKQ